MVEILLLLWQFVIINYALSLIAFIISIWLMILCLIDRKNDKK